jgi:hypothetical protein
MSSLVPGAAGLLDYEVLTDVLEATSISSLNLPIFDLFSLGFSDFLEEHTEGALWSLLFPT